MDNNIEQKETFLNKLVQPFSTSKRTVKFITRVGMFTALSMLFYLKSLPFKFPLTFLFPSFLEINFSNVFIIMGSLSTGPIGGLLICIIRFVLKILFESSRTGFAGELFDLVLSIMIILPSSIYYLYNKTKKGGLLSIVISLSSWLIFSVFFNWTIALPMYVKVFFNGNVDGLVSMISPYINSVNASNYIGIYLFGVCLPFNAINGIINCGIAAFLYKKIQFLLTKAGL